MAPLDPSISQAIASYEKQQKLPYGWINYALSRSSSSFQELEQKSVADALGNARLWDDFKTPRKTLKQAAQDNITMLGDPVSLKAETADSEPTDQDRGARSSARTGKTSKSFSDDTEERGNSSGSRSLKEAAKNNRSMLGDPVSLKAEASESEPTDQDRGAKSAPHASAVSGKHGKTEVTGPPRVDAEAVWQIISRVSGRRADPKL
ncbi:hypothetical protein LTR16_003056 [Cryomyces antarcticus]|uniref:Uncharacterized protein n=1 Tax=Cryomyces antarcticus TaxID=329879 RepID=A0ABR0LZT9_9PEZI|nr:hypothetical protein LTR16_003056 [Cryomyces antarcticus]